MPTRLRSTALSKAVDFDVSALNAMVKLLLYKVNNDSNYLLP